MLLQKKIRYINILFDKQLYLLLLRPSLGLLHHDNVFKIWHYRE